MNEGAGIQVLDEGDERGKAGWRRFWPLVLLALLAAAVFASGAADYVRPDTLAAHFAAMRQYVHAHPVLSLLMLIVIYAAGTAVSFPAMSVITVFTGALYGVWLGSIGVALGATIGATIIFQATHTSLGAVLRAKAAPWLKRLQRGFRRNEFFYLLALRLIPVIPFWVLNIAPGVIGMRLRNYVLATLLGILPGVVVYVGIGAGAADLLARGGEIDLGEALMRPRILLPLLGLALLALAPVLLRRWGPVAAVLGANGDAGRNGRPDAGD